MFRNMMAVGCANLLRRNLNITNGNISIRKIADRFNIDLCIEDFVTEIDGISFLDDDVAAIAINSRLTTDQAVEVFLHEVFHIITGMMSNREYMHIYTKLHGESTDDDELACDYFSRAVLMPENEFIKAFKMYTNNECRIIERLANKFGVTIISVVERIIDLNLKMKRRELIKEVA